MPKIISKLLISVLSAFVLLMSFAPSAFAQNTSEPWYNQSFGQWSTKVFDDKNPNEIFGERYTYAQVNWILNSLIAVMVGSKITSCIQLGSTGDLSKIGDCASKLAPPDATKILNNSKPSLLPTTPSIGSSGPITGLAYLTGNLIAFRPASGVQYVKTTAANLHLISPAYAQTGAGFNTLSPVQSLWQVVRDISYALMVVVIIAMAFMIMFRTKISPQVVITVQSALPKIAIALILITFSYAIAGLLVDLMYVVIGAFAAMIKIGGNTISTAPGPVDLFNQLNSLNGLVSLSVGIVILAILLAGVGIFAGAAAIPAGVVIPIVGSGAALGGVIILIIFAVFLLFILFRLFWLMVRTAAITVLLIIVGPIIILTETVGGGKGFWGWIRNLLANLAVYPTVAIMIFFSHYFFWAWALGALDPANNFKLLNTYNIQSLKGGGIINLPGMPLGTGVLGFVLSFVILFLIPRASHIIEAMIEGKKVDVGGAVSEAANPFGIGTFLTGAATGGVGHYIGGRVEEYLRGKYSPPTKKERTSEQAVASSGGFTKQ